MDREGRRVPVDPQETQGLSPSVPLSTPASPVSTECTVRPRGALMGGVRDERDSTGLWADSESVGEQRREL